MAGIAGILEGLGDAGKALAQTTTPTALGPSQSVDADKVGLSLLGGATESVAVSLLTTTSSSPSFITPLSKSIQAQS